MKTETRLFGVMKSICDAVAEGLELKPVSGPVENTAARIFLILAVVLLAAKLTADFAGSPALKQIALWVAVVSFFFCAGAMLLQWNRSLLWSRSASKRTSNHR